MVAVEVLLVSEIPLPEANHFTNSPRLDRRPKPDASPAVRAAGERRGRKRRRQSTSSERGTTPSFEHPAVKNKSAPLPGPSRRSQRRVSSSALASHNRTDTASRRSTRTIDSPSSYSSNNMLQQHLSNRRGGPSRAMAASSTQARRRSVDAAGVMTTTTTLTTTTTMSSTIAGAVEMVATPVRDEDAAIVIEDTPVLESSDVIGNEDAPSPDIFEYESSCDTDDLIARILDFSPSPSQGPPLQGTSTNPFLIEDSVQPAVTLSDVRAIVTEEVRAMETRMLARILEMVSASVNAADGKGKGRRT
jgi:hypothetical protein